MLNEIEKILENYTKEDYQIFYDTVDMLCKNGVGNGFYQDYDILTDVLSILSICENIIKNK